MSVVTDQIHGTVAMYKVGGCRCEPCTAAFMAYVPHGTISGATYHKCPCSKCRHAKHEYSKQYLRRVTQPRTLPPWSLDDLRKRVLTYVESTGRPPNRDSGDIAGLEGRTWSTAERWLRARGITFRMLAGLPPGGIGRRDDDFEWTLEVVREAASAFALAHGRLPALRDGAVEAFGGRHWGAALRWLQQHDLSLRELLSEGPPARMRGGEMMAGAMV